MQSVTDVQNCIIWGNDGQFTAGWLAVDPTIILACIRSSRILQGWTSHCCLDHPVSTQAREQILMARLLISVRGATSTGSTVTGTASPM